MTTLRDLRHDGAHAWNYLRPWSKRRGKWRIAWRQYAEPVPRIGPPH